MERINLGEGRWFDPESARSWDEDWWWDGSNRRSQATGSQWEHQKLYRTRKGQWILHCWSQWQGSQPSYEIVGDATAKTWLIDNGHHKAVEELFPQALAEAEV